MDLMTGTTNYTALKTKYSNFMVPALEIKVDGSKMVSSGKIKVQELMVDLTCGYEASGCEFLLGDCYDTEKEDFDRDVSNKFQIGKKVEVLIGYEKAEKVVF